MLGASEFREFLRGTPKMTKTRKKRSTRYNINVPVSESETQAALHRTHFQFALGGCLSHQRRTMKDIQPHPLLHSIL